MPPRGTRCSAAPDKPLDSSQGRDHLQIQRGRFGNERNPVNFIDPDGNNPLLITAAIGAGVGALIGGGMALWNDPHASLGNVLASAGKGAAIGGLVGLTGGLAFDSALAAAGLSAATATPLQLATAGAIGAGFGDMAGQSGAGALGWQNGYNPTQTALSMAFGFGGGYGFGKFCPAAPWSSGLGPEDFPANSTPTTLTLNGDLYPVSAANLEEANAVGVPLPVNRARANANRAAALQGLPKIPGLDLDEAPPAMFRNPGDPVVVRPTPPGDNRGAGASLGNQARETPDGGQVIIVIKSKMK